MMSISCSTMTQVRPPARKCRMVSDRKPMAASLSPAQGSSSTSTRGAAISARPSSSSLCCPPDSSPAGASASSRPAASWSSSARARSVAARSAIDDAGRPPQRCQQLLAGLPDARQQQVLEHGQPAERAGDLERPRQAERQQAMRRETVDAPAVEHDASGVRPQLAGEHRQQRGLAGAVGTDQPGDAAGRHVEGNTIDGGQATEAARYFMY